MDASNYLGHHPFVGFISCASLLLSSIVVPQFEFPIWIMQSFQVLAWASTGVIATITFLGWLDKEKKKRAIKQRRKK